MVNMPKNRFDLELLMDMKVKEVMAKNPPICKPKTLVLDMLKKLRTQKEDYVLIVGDNRQLLGIVTESDILHALKRPSGHMFIGTRLMDEMKKIVARTVEEIMSRHPLTVHGENTVREALDTMVTHKFRHLPVTEQDRVIGAVSIHDIIVSILKLAK